MRKTEKENCFGVTKNLYLDVLCLGYISDDQVEMLSKLGYKSEDGWRWGFGDLNLGVIKLKMTFKAMGMEDTQNVVRKRVTRTNKAMGHSYWYRSGRWELPVVETERNSHWSKRTKSKWCLESVWRKSFKKKWSVLSNVADFCIRWSFRINRSWCWQKQMIYIILLT